MEAIEKTCDDLASFFLYQSNQFSSYSVSVRDDEMLLECGLGGPVLDENVETLQQRRAQFEQLNRMRLSVCSAHQFNTGIQPRSLPPIRLPSLGITLQ